MSSEAQLRAGILAAIQAQEETLKALEEVEDAYGEDRASAAEYRHAWENHHRAKVAAAEAHRAFRDFETARVRERIAEVRGTP